MSGTFITQDYSLSEIEKFILTRTLHVTSYNTYLKTLNIIERSVCINKAINMYKHSYLLYQKEAHYELLLLWNSGFLRMFEDFFIRVSI